MRKSRPKPARPARGARQKVVPAKSRRSMQGGTKQARMIQMLRSPEGATIAAMAKAFGWTAHTVRGVLSGVVKKKLGLAIKSHKPENGERVYRIA